MGRLAAVLALAACCASAPLSFAAAEEDGAELFDLCMQCHGSAGQGIPLALAPSIAGLQEWYVKAQLQKFRAGVRGLHPDDRAGLRMYPMSQAIRNDAQLEALAAYVAQLPPQKPESTLDGDPTRGKALYVTCAACHGQNGEGLAPLEAPSLTHASDWYLLTQLKHFKDGIRGTNPGDTSGARMRPMAMVLADEQAMKDVIAYVTTLSR